MQLKLSSRDTLIVAVVAMVVVAGLVIFFGIAPRFAELGRLDREIAAADQRIAEAQAVLARRQEAKSESAKTQAELLALANKMPDQPELSTLIIELQDTANEAGLDFVMINPTEPAVDAGFSKIAMDMTVTGQWADIIEYLRRLAKLDRQVRILHVVVRGATTGLPAAEAAASTELAADVKLEAYTLAAPATPASGTPAPVAPATATQ